MGRPHNRRVRGFCLRWAGRGGRVGRWTRQHQCFPSMNFWPAPPCLGFSALGDTFGTFSRASQPHRRLPRSEGSWVAQPARCLVLWPGWLFTWASDRTSTGHFGFYWGCSTSSVVLLGQLQCSRFGSRTSTSRRQHPCKSHLRIRLERQERHPHHEPVEVVAASLLRSVRRLPTPCTHGWQNSRPLTDTRRTRSAGPPGF